MRYVALFYASLRTGVLKFWVKSFSSFFMFYGFFFHALGLRLGSGSGLRLELVFNKLSSRCLIQSRSQGFESGGTEEILGKCTDKMLAMH